ncbi:DNA-directed RNA polymerase subunit beta [Lacticaseibacillus sp. N501-2]|uniref:DNA-directed RNA polymerase subunit beta n=1 Tax=Lacticaseibacillus salsurae TaxID=3367729 RepID=UPI0038B339ED
MAYVVPRELWLYDDRGMMNWMGWLLSDHSAFMEQAAHKDQPQAPRAAMTDAAIDSTLQQAFQKRQVVAIQLNAMWDAAYLPEVVGVVVGCDAGRVFLQAQDGGIQALSVADMRHVRTVASKHWWAA